MATGEGSYVSERKRGLEEAEFPWINPIMADRCGVDPPGDRSGRGGSGLFGGLADDE